MHLSVMPEEALSLLNVRSDGTYLDATAGLGGHTKLIAQRLTSGMVIANDRDPKSLELARRITEEWSERIRYIHGPFRRLAEGVAAARASGFEALDSGAAPPVSRAGTGAVRTAESGVF